MLAARRLADRPQRPADRFSSREDTMTMLTRRGLLGAAAAFTAAGSLTQTPARAAAPMIGKQGPSFYRYKIGDFEVTVFSEGSVRNAAVQNMALTKRLPEFRKGSAMRSCRPALASTSSIVWWGTRAAIWVLLTL